MTNKIFNILLFIVFNCGVLFSQIPLVDKGIFVEGLWCFPLHNDSTSYVYLPNNGRLAQNNSKEPQFSFLRYVINKPVENKNNRGITEADGGAILHFLVLYETSETTIKVAENALQQKLNNNKNIKLKGPMPFEKGSYALISSIINNKSNKEEKVLLSTGDAPVFENNSIALSFSLTPLQSLILLESFKTKTPDISIVFDLSFSGLTEAFDAELEVDWTEIQKSKAFKAGASIYFVSADIELGFEKLRRDNAIKLKTYGNSASLEGLLNTVYDRLLTLLFKPVKPESVDQTGGMADAIGAMGRKSFGFGINVGYQLKEMQSTGISRLFFKGRNSVIRHHYISYNIGDLYSKYGANDQFFKDIPLWDLTFQQREIFVSLDGDMQKHFEKMLNGVSILFQKDHQSGRSESPQEIYIHKETFKQAKILSFYYGYDRDTNRLEWLNYQYKVIWKFQGGGTYELPWDTASASMINLYAPFKNKTITLDGDLTLLDQKGVRATSVSIYYPFFGKKKNLTIKLNKYDKISEKYFDITLQDTVDEIDYEITWIKSNRDVINKIGKDKYGLIFIDDGFD